MSNETDSKESTASFCAYQQPFNRDKLSYEAACNRQDLCESFATLVDDENVQKKELWNQWLDFQEHYLGPRILEEVLISVCPVACEAVAIAAVRMYELTMLEQAGHEEAFGQRTIAVLMVDQRMGDHVAGEPSKSAEIKLDAAQSLLIERGSKSAHFYDQNLIDIGAVAAVDHPANNEVYEIKLAESTARGALISNVMSCLLNFSRPLASFRSTLYLELDCYGQVDASTGIDELFDLNYTKLIRFSTSVMEREFDPKSPNKEITNSKLYKNLGHDLFQQRQRAVKQAILYYQPHVKSTLFEVQPGTSRKTSERRLREKICAPGAKDNTKKLYLRAHVDKKYDTISEVTTARVETVRGLEYFGDTALLAIDLRSSFAHECSDSVEETLWRHLALDQINFHDIEDDKPLSQAISQSSFDPQLNHGALRARAEELGEACDKSWAAALFLAPRSVFNWVAHRQLARWMRYVSAVRELYPTYFQQHHEGKWHHSELVEHQALSDCEPLVAKQRSHRAGDLNLDLGEATVGTVKTLVDKLLGVDRKNPATDRKVKMITNDSLRNDSRMHVYALYGLVGSGFDSERLSRTVALTTMIDAPESAWSSANGFAYSEKYVRNFLDKNSLGMWQHVGTDYGYTDFSHIGIGAGPHFNNEIVQVHFWLYERMVANALLKRLCLNQFFRRMTRLSQEFDRNDPKMEKHWIDGYHRLRGDFIDFTNGYWFPEVTTALQGQEMRLKQMQAMDLEANYQRIQNELEQAYEYSQSLFAKSVQGFATLVSYVGLAAALFFGIMGVLPFEKSQLTLKHFSFVFIVSIALPALGMYLISLHRKR